MLRMIHTRLRRMLKFKREIIFMNSKLNLRRRGEIRWIKLYIKKWYLIMSKNKKKHHKFHILKDNKKYP